jgi:hypothetical protein
MTSEENQNLMEVIIQDPLDILSKTQKTKIRRQVRSIWTTEDAFYDEIDAVLSSIHYPEDIQNRYNTIRFHTDTIHANLTLCFDYIPEQTAEEKRQILLNKLHSRIKGEKNKNSSDPQWKAYESLHSRVPSNVKSMIPTPDQVRAHPDMYRNMLSMLPAQNPLSSYLSLFSL